MRVPLDQNVPRQLVQMLSQHDAIRASQMGRAEIGNGELVAAAEREGFEVLLSADQNIRYRQSLVGRRIALVVFPTNNYSHIREHSRTVVAAIEQAGQGSYREVELPRLPLVRRPPPEQDQGC